MPSYTFQNTRTKETREVFAKHSEIANGYKPDNDEWERIFEPTSIRTDTCNRIGSTTNTFNHRTP